MQKATNITLYVSCKQTYIEIYKNIQTYINIPRYIKIYKHILNMYTNIQTLTRLLTAAYFMITVDSHKWGGGWGGGGGVSISSKQILPLALLLQ